jgi:hypothetical protein
MVAERGSYGKCRLIILLSLILIKFIRIFSAKPSASSGTKQEEQKKSN